MVGQRTVFAYAGEYVINALLSAELHAALAIKADAVEHGDGIVGTDAKVAGNGLALLLAIGEKAKQEGQQCLLVVCAVADGQRKRERCAVVPLVIFEMDEALRILPERPSGVPADDGAQREFCHDTSYVVRWNYLAVTPLLSWKMSAISLSYAL